jgi:VIT1/CCC1 family predicted Fe2+/Mn2+ transporter
MQALIRSCDGADEEYNIWLDADRLRDQIATSQKNRKFFSRLAMALFGGAALIAPMLIMTLHQTKLTSLLTTSLFVVAVAVTLAWWMEDAKNQDVIAATAAYAAVLVVFVGTGTTTTG